MINSADTINVLAQAAEEIMQASGVSITPDGMERLRALPPEAPQTVLAWRIVRLLEEMRSLAGEIVFSCPRCGGSGEFTITCEDGNGCSERCRPCHGTGKVTKQDWKEWC